MAEMDAVFKALGDPTRRRMLDSLNARGGQNLMELCAGLDMARQSVSKHLAVLEAADLVTTVKRGREKLHFLNPAPINDIGQRWINQYDRQRIEALDDLKHVLEGTSVENRTFVYKTYINSSPELLWKGLTDPAFTKRYWGLELITDWKVGSPITWNMQNVTVADPAQVVLEADPFRRLAYTWHSFTPEWAKACEIDDERFGKLAAEQRSRASFDIEPVDGMCKLTVVHEFLDQDTIAIDMVSDGWPRVLSDLKSFLETGGAE
jgi:DNA-binding transcriptional ArsR family regulator